MKPDKRDRIHADELIMIKIGNNYKYTKKRIKI